MKKLFFLSIILGLFLLVSVSAIRTEFFNGVINQQENMYGNNWAAQTFTVGTVGPNTNYTITKVGLNLAKSGVPPVDLEINIMSINSNGHPSGQILSHGTIDSTSLSSHPIFTWINITMTPLTVSPSNTYAIQLNSSAGFANYYNWGETIEGGYSGGVAKYSSNSGGQWFNLDGRDMNFEIYSEPSTPNSTLYDDFSGLTLDPQRWQESQFHGNPYPELHNINTVSQTYQVTQTNPLDAEVILTPTRQFNIYDVVEYEVIYNGGTGNHLLQPLINGNYPPSQIEPCNNPSAGCGPIGFWNGEPDLGAIQGTYKIKFIFFNDSVKMIAVRPDELSITNTFTGNSAPFTLGINAHTGNDGTMNFEIDNVRIYNTTPLTPSLDRIGILEMRVNALESRIAQLENVSQNLTNKTNSLDNRVSYLERVLASILRRIGIGS